MLRDHNELSVRAREVVEHHGVASSGRGRQSEGSCVSPLGFLSAQISRRVECLIQDFTLPSCLPLHQVLKCIALKGISFHWERVACHDEEAQLGKLGDRIYKPLFFFNHVKWKVQFSELTKHCLGLWLCLCVNFDLDSCLKLLIFPLWTLFCLYHTWSLFFCWLLLHHLSKKSIRIVFIVLVNQLQVVFGEVFRVEALELIAR